MHGQILKSPSHCCVAHCDILLFETVAKKSESIIQNTAHGLLM